MKDCRPKWVDRDPEGQEPWNWEPCTFGHVEANVIGGIVNDQLSPWFTLDMTKDSQNPANPNIPLVGANATGSYWFSPRSQPWPWKEGRTPNVRSRWAMTAFATISGGMGIANNIVIIRAGKQEIASIQTANGPDLYTWSTVRAPALILPLDWDGQLELAAYWSLGAVPWAGTNEYKLRFAPIRWVGEE